MNRILRVPCHSPLGAAITALLLAGVWLFWREPLQGVLSHFDEVRYWQQALADTAQHKERLDQQMGRSGARLRAKSHIAHELAEGRISLAEAARQVSQLPDAPPNFWEELRKAEKGATDHERLCRHMIDWVCLEVEATGGPTDEVRRRLEVELQRELEQQ